MSHSTCNIEFKLFYKQLQVLGTINTKNSNIFSCVSIADVIMTFKSKLKTVFELSILKLRHMPNLISERVKMPQLRRSASPQAVRGTKRPRLLGLKW